MQFYFFSFKIYLVKVFDFTKESSFYPYSENFNLYEYSILDKSKLYTSFLNILLV